MSRDNCPVDPRIQVELEKLNTATDNINKYEVELDDAKHEFKQLLVESVDRIKQAGHKLSNSIQTAKPYYEARLYAGQLAKEHQLAAANHEKARSVHAVAKEMVYLAEQGLGEKSTLDTACQEMLSHAASRVNESQLEFTETKNAMKICELKQEVANHRVAKLQTQLKSAIKASSLRIRRTFLMINCIVCHQHDWAASSFAPYYESRANYNGLLKAQKNRITDLDSKVRESKTTYNEALRILEQISEEIHRMRSESASSSVSTPNEVPSSNASGMSEKMNDDLEAGISFVHGVKEAPSLSSSAIYSADEYLEFPPHLSTQSSPIRQRNLDALDCPHLLKGFVGYMPHQKNDGGSSLLASNSPGDNVTMTSDDIEQWTEIRLSNSESSSSGYSQHSQPEERTTPNTESSSSSLGQQTKVTCHTILNITDVTAPCVAANDDPSSANTNSNNERLAGWITKSNLKQSNSRRQSLDILIDASDRVKDAFATGFSRVGKSLERRNSESEATPCSGDGSGKGESSSDFFSAFSRSDHKEVLTDEQVENLLLSEDCADMLRSVLNISKP